MTQLRHEKVQNPTPNRHIAVDNKTLMYKHRSQNKGKENLKLKLDGRSALIVQLSIERHTF